MKTISLKHTLLSVLILGFFSHAEMASANAINGTLGNAAGATDFYRVTCSKNANGDTSRFAASVRDLLPVATPLISVQIIKANTSYAKNSTDPVDGNNTPSSSVVIQPVAPFSGNGVYEVRVNKTAAGAESYRLNFTCYSSTNLVTGTALVKVQDQ